MGLASRAGDAHLPLPPSLCTERAEEDGALRPRLRPQFPQGPAGSSQSPRLSGGRREPPSPEDTPRRLGAWSHRRPCRRRAGGRARRVGPAPTRTKATASLARRPLRGRHLPPTRLLARPLAQPPQPHHQLPTPPPTRRERTEAAGLGLAPSLGSKTLTSPSPEAGPG